ncbi:ankyrin repeat, SAM and basic leucine zipper domain-containing protein 1 [Anopheles nili]|uniref:ankyrin repeat, SAM and basic leucine zipper domain-containing protein 1 n=1 Tax=Anopheles nili TaxID=185578 RepID=UPI00237C4D49|nr:ankyrin repeat, SAM and basic leucine zipper domain-containing protein 1 [Anopheles nili]
MYRPAGYDDSDDDDFDDYGFISSYSGVKTKPNTLVNMQTPIDDFDTLLYNAVLDGNLEEIKRILKEDEYFRAGEILRQGWPLLFYACFEAKLEVVEYLVQELKMDVNRLYNLQSALMITCSSTHATEQVYPIVRLLLDNGAIIGLLDQYGYSPLMLACKEGHLEVVKEIVGESSLLSADNDGNTALFHAVNNNHYEIVMVLLNAGALTHIVNGQGCTPRQCAINKNYKNIAELFPEEETPYELPSKFLCYKNYRNLIHGDNEKASPNYCPDIGLMLFGMNSESKLAIFAQANMNLFEFLTLTDEKLQFLNMKYPIERKRILLGLYDFHLQKWSNNSVWTMSKQSILDFYDLLEAFGNILKHLTVMHGSVVFTKTLTSSNGSKAFSHAIQNSTMIESLANFLIKIRDVKSQINTLHKLSSPNPVLYVKPKHKKVNFFSKMVKVSICLMIGSAVCLLKCSSRKL